MNDYIKETGWPEQPGVPDRVEFTLQSGLVEDVGVNGCQIDDVVRWAKNRLEELNKTFPCRENSLAITKLDEAILWLYERKRDREARGVKGRHVA